jgi:hypothetical protein
MANGCGRSPDHNVSLLSDDLVGPELLHVFRQRRNHGGDLCSRCTPLRQVRNKSRQHGAQVEIAFGSHQADDSDKTDHDNPDKPFQEPVEHFGRQSTTTVHHHGNSGRSQNNRGHHYLVVASATDRSGQQVLLQSSKAQAKLWHAENHIGDDGAVDPAPAQHGIDVSVDGSERAFSRR